MVTGGILVPSQSSSMFLNDFHEKLSEPTREEGQVVLAVGKCHLLVELTQVSFGDARPLAAGRITMALP